MASPLKKAVSRMASLERVDLVVTLYPGGVIGLRQKRCRKEYTLPLMAVYKQAILADQERVKAERRKQSGRRTLVNRGLLR